MLPKAECTTVTCLNGGTCDGVNTCNCTGTGYSGYNCYIRKSFRHKDL